MTPSEPSIDRYLFDFDFGMNLNADGIFIPAPDTTLVSLSIAPRYSGMGRVSVYGIAVNGGNIGKLVYPICQEVGVAHWEVEFDKEMVFSEDTGFILDPQFEEVGVSYIVSFDSLSIDGRMVSTDSYQSAEWLGFVPIRAMSSRVNLKNGGKYCSIQNLYCSQWHCVQ